MLLSFIKEYVPPHLRGKSDQAQVAGTPSPATAPVAVQAAAAAASVPQPPQQQQTDNSKFIPNSSSFIFIIELKVEKKKNVQKKVICPIDFWVYKRKESVKFRIFNMMSFSYPCLTICNYKKT